MAAGLERALPDWRRRLEAVLAAEEALYAPFPGARSRRRCRHRVPMAQFRSLSAADVPRHPGRVRRRRLSRPPADRGRHHQHQRARRDRRRAAVPAHQRGQVGGRRARARRPSSRTPPRAACRRRCRAPTPAGAPFARWQATSSCRCSRGSPGRTLARAELTPAHARRGRAPRWPRLHLRERRLSPTAAPAATSRRRSTARLARIAALARPELAPAVAVLAPELARLRAERAAGRAARDHPRRSVRRQRALRRRAAR